VENDTAKGRFYAPAMTFAPHRKEQEMKSSATHKLVRLAAVLAPAATAAALSGHIGWSDATLKQDVTMLDGSLAKLRKL
jgi:hypothetical protein